MRPEDTKTEEEYNTALEQERFNEEVENLERLAIRGTGKQRQYARQKLYAMGYPIDIKFEDSFAQNCN